MSFRSGNLLKWLILFVLLFVTSLHEYSAQEISRTIQIGPFLPYKTGKDPAMANRIREALAERLKRQGYRIVFNRSDSPQGARERARSENHFLGVAGYYGRSKKGDLNLYGWIYHPETGYVIDAYNKTQEPAGLGDVKLPDEARTAAAEVIAKFAAKITLRIRSNPGRRERRSNINEFIVDTPIVAAIPFPLRKEDLGKESGEVFKLLRADEIVSASGTRESRRDAPASFVLVTAREIEERNYTNLGELMQELPGFDTALSGGGTSYLNAYQRGYRTPFNTKTLFLLNGIVENNLWSQHGDYNRQYPMSAIQRVEVLYGPASAVYGANAFLGVVNIITYDGSELKDGESRADINFSVGDYKSRNLDATVRGKSGAWHYSVSARFYRSDGPDFSDRQPFLSNNLYSNTRVWGPLLLHEHRGEKFGKYYSPSDINGAQGTLTYKNLQIGFIDWTTKEGYGSYYPADRAQNNSFWNASSRQMYMRYKKQISGKLKSTSLILTRESRIFGLWAEATPDWNAGQEEYSYVSYTDWNSESNSRLFKQDFEYRINRKSLLLTGLKYERKELTKAYDIPGYFGAYSSTTPWNTPGPHGFGTAIYHSSDPLLIKPPSPRESMPSDNLTLSDDLGGFILGIYDHRRFRLNAGVRYDENSEYGVAVNPRLSAIYKVGKRSALKLLYGEAFQEPSALQRYGGWNGREANPDLIPEKVRNLEFIGQLHPGKTYHELSLYFASYENVVKEESENAGLRWNYGAEYKFSLRLPRFFQAARPPTLSFNYTYAIARSSVRYDHEKARWVKVKSLGDDVLGNYLGSQLSPLVEAELERLLGPLNAEQFARSQGYLSTADLGYYSGYNPIGKNGHDDLGDIARHKAGLAFNIPIKNRYNLNLRGEGANRRVLYQRNALRNRRSCMAENPNICYLNEEQLAAYFVVHISFRMKLAFGALTLKVANLLDEEYSHPGPETGSAGNDITQRSKGWHNSLLPQPGRYYLFTLTVKL